MKLTLHEANSASAPMRIALRQKESSRPWASSLFWSCLSYEARVRVRSFGFSPAVLQWHFVAFSDAVCLCVHFETVPWEWLHEVLCASWVAIPRTSNL